MRRALLILRRSVAGVTILVKLVVPLDDPIEVITGSAPLPFPIVSQNLPRPSESPLGEASTTGQQPDIAALFPQCLKRPRCRASKGLISCCLVPRVFPCISLATPGMSRAPTNGTSVGNSALAARMMCLYVLMVVAM